MSETPHQPEETPKTTANLAEATEKRVEGEKSSAFIASAADFIRTVIIVFALATVLRIFVVQPFVVEGSSMVPRFETSDYLIVDKISYRISKPERGDIIVFRYPNQPTINYVKRIIGMPGERVRIENNTVTIFNSEHPQGVTLNESPYLLSSVITAIPGTGSKEVVVTEGNYFVMGDNRPASSDSREWGLLPNANIVGRVVFQAFPLSRASFISHARYQE